MPDTNDASSVYGNERNRFNKAISDTNDHDFPDVGAASSTGYNVGSASVIQATVINNEDQALTARLEATGSRDAGSFSEPVTVVQGVPVSASGGVQALVWREAEDGDYAQLRVVVSFGSSPTGNNDTVVEFRKGGG